MIDTASKRRDGTCATVVEFTNRGHQGAADDGKRMTAPESPLAEAERRVAEAEAFVAHQADFAVRMLNQGHDGAAHRARALLETFERALEILREHLRQEQARNVAGEP